MGDKPLALITGAAQGIGYACAEALEEDGYGVILADINEDGVMAAGKALGAVASYACDLGDTAQIIAMFDAIAKDHGVV
ncbi:MAG: SDR family NAD(P)-dependent oxidoreductase, partial [Sulfitobacter sp.]